MFRALVLLSLFCLSCAHQKASKETFVDLGAGASLALKEPKDIFLDIQWVQILSFEFKDKKNSIQSVLTAKDNQITIVGLLPFGGEAFMVEYSNNEIRSRSLPMGSEFDLKFALADIILVYSDADKLQSWLSKGTLVVDKGLTRVISLNGQDIVQITYSSVDKPTAVIDYKHLIRGYQLKITPVSQRSAP